jgi:carbonic anhydrase
LRDQLSALNVAVLNKYLMSYATVQEWAITGTLHLSTRWFDSALGTMYAYGRAGRSFDVIDRIMAERLLRSRGPLSDVVASSADAH